MEQVRDVKLDNICEGINDARATKNSATKEESGLIAAALERMHSKKQTIYKHGGVELALVPGSDRLRVRLTKDDGDVEVGTGATTIAGEGEGEAESDGVDNGDQEDML